MLALLSLLVAATHPSLFFGSADVPALRQEAQTTHASIANHIKAILDAHLNDPTPSATEYDDYRFLGNQVLVWAFGYQLTGNTAYASKARSQLLTYAGWSTWDNGETQSEGGPDLAEAHMLTGTSVAYDWIYETLSAVDRTTIATKIGTEAQKVAAYWPNAWWNDQYLQNHNWIDTAGLGLAGLALAGEDSRAASWVNIAKGNLANLQISIGQIPDGSWHEGLPYEGYGLSMSLPFWMALKHSGTDYTDLGLLRGYGKMLLYAGVPDAPQQMILPFGDFTHWPGWQAVQISRFTAGRFADPYAAAASQRYVAAIPRGNFLPETYYDVFEFLGYDPTVTPLDPHTQPLDASFTDIGAATMHSSWDTGDFALGFKAAVFGGFVNFNRLAVNGAPGGWIDWGHDHNDDMSFWLFGKGVWLAPEAMGYDAGKSTDYTYPASQTAYHNVLLVDGNGQLGDTRISDSNWNNPWFFNRISQPLFAPTGTADYAIAGGAGPGLYDTTLGMSRWDRVVVLARSRYALVHDDVAASVSHNYDWLCHFQDGVSVDTASGWVQGVGKSGWSTGVRVLSPASWTATTGTQTAELMDQFDPDASTSYVRVRSSTKAAAQQFLMALMPVQTSAWASRTAVNALDSSDTEAGAVVAPGSSLEERWIFARNGASGKTAGDLVLSGSIAGMAARNASGSPLRAVLFGAGSLSDQSGGRLLLSSASAKSIEAKIAGTVLQISGDSIADFHAYAPAATSITINGAAASATFESGMVTYPALPPPPAHLVVGPSSLTFASTQTGDVPAPQSLTLLDDGGQSLGWTASSDDGAVSVDVSSGTLAAGASTAVTVSVATQATAGSRTSHVTIDAGSAGKLVVPLAITFTAPPAHLLVAPGSLTFASTQAGNTPPSTALTVLNDGGQNLSWTATSDDPAVSVDVSSGSLGAGANASVTVSVATQASAGSRTSHLTIDAGAAGTAVVPLSITFTAAPPPPPPPAAISITPATLVFAEQIGNTPASRSLVASNTGGQPMSWSATSDDPAVSIDVASGTVAAGANSVITVSVATQAAAGSRPSHVTIDAGAAGTAVIPLAITFTNPPLSAGQLSVTPLTLSFEAQAGTAPAPLSIIASNIGGQTLSWTMSADGNGLTPSTTEGTLAGGAGQVVQISVAPSATAGQRTVNLTLDAGAAGKIVVAANITFTDPPPADDGGTADTGVSSTAVVPAHGCSHSGSTPGWLFVAGLLAFSLRRRRS